MPLESSFPKTTRPSAKKQRPVQSSEDNMYHGGKRLDAFPDKIDVRDWLHQPSLMALPNEVINCHLVPPAAILDQGKEGACTGFALAAVINFHLCKNNRCTVAGLAKAGASPRMLYELARRYDEWPGEAYEGSSARGTIKGWSAHGVAKRTTWKDSLFGFNHFDDKKAKEALDIPAGAYYRVMHRNIRDMHAALYESGILYATLMVHEGWRNPNENKESYSYKVNGRAKQIKLPVIRRTGRATGGHAVAIVGYTREGFVIQNSWGPTWGEKGFAVLPYEDWMLHSMDCWVVQLGVPVLVDLWNTTQYADTPAGKQRASEVIPLEQIRPYVINIGNNGHLSTSGYYWTSPDDVKRLFKNIGDTAKGWKKKRVMLYLHGGLNSEKEVAQRIISFKQVCLENEIYPVHIMWETDFWNSLKNDVLDRFTDDDKAGFNWLKKLREGTLEIMDRTVEITVSKPGTLLWNEMKENARLSSVEGRAMEIVAKEALEALQRTGARNGSDWELHLVAHSAGAIFTAYAIDVLLSIGVPVKSVQFMAPAITTDLFKQKLMNPIKDGRCPLPALYLLSDVGERDDTVGPYGKSLLYLVSNAFEGRRGVPLLGMERFVNAGNKEVAKLGEVDKEIAALYAAPNGRWTSLVIAGAVVPEKGKEEVRPDVSRSNSHGGFDNDPHTMNAVLYRILGAAPKKIFDVRSLQF